jgi:hypothetical protein
MTQARAKAEATPAAQAQSFSIGQVVYILSNKGQSLLPAMVVEESIIKSLEGTSSSWKLAIGKTNNPEKPQKIVDSTRINGEIYASLDAVHKVLHERLVEFITDLVNSAKRREELWYGTLKQKSNVKKEPAGANGEQQYEPEDLIEEIEGAVVPDGSPAPVVAPSSNTDALREKIKNLATPDGNEDPIATPDASFVIEGPEGTRIPVKVNV